MTINCLLCFRDDLLARAGSVWLSQASQTVRAGDICAIKKTWSHLIMKLNNEFFNLVASDQSASEVVVGTVDVKGALRSDTLE